MPVGKGSLERAVKAKKAAEEKVEPKKVAEKKSVAKKAAPKKVTPKNEAPKNEEVAIGKTVHKAIKIGDPMPIWML